MMISPPFRTKKPRAQAAKVGAVAGRKPKSPTPTRPRWFSGFAVVQLTTSVPFGLTKKNIRRVHLDWMCTQVHTAKHHTRIGSPIIPPRLCHIAEWLTQHRKPTIWAMAVRCQATILRCTPHRASVIQSLTRTPPRSFRRSSQIRLMVWV